MTKLSAEHRKIFQDVSGFREIYKTADLPAPVLALCGDPDGRLAERGEEWEAGCMRSGKFPSHRLIWAVSNGKIYVVHVESGGYVHWYHTLLILFKSGTNAERLWWTSDSLSFRDFNGFLRALNTDQLDNY